MTRFSTGSFDGRLALVLACLAGSVALEACTRLGGGDGREVSVERGQQVYQTYCQTCHGDAKGDGRLPNVPSHGPDGHTWHHSDRNLMEIIRDGSDSPMSRMMREMMGSADAPRMPAWKETLSDEDVRSVIAYLKTFWTEEQRRFQRDTPMMR